MHTITITLMEDTLSNIKADVPPKKTYLKIQKTVTTSVTGFIRKCISNVVPTVRVRCFPNQKLCINTKVGAKLKNRATAHRAIADNPDATVKYRNKYKKARYDLCRVIK